MTMKEHGTYYIDQVFLNVQFVNFRIEVFGYVFISNIDQIKVSISKKHINRPKFKISKRKNRELIIRR